MTVTVVEPELTYQLFASKFVHWNNDHRKAFRQQTEIEIYI